MAVERLKANQIQSAQQVPNLLQQVKYPSSNTGKIAIASANAIEFVNINDIVYLQADGVYTHVYLNNNTITSTKNLKEFDDLLRAQNFFRIHHSYLVNMNHIKKYIKGDGGSVIMVNDIEIEVSRRRKSAFLEILSTI